MAAHPIQIKAKTSLQCLGCQIVPPPSGEMLSTGVPLLQGQGTPMNPETCQARFASGPSQDQLHLDELRVGASLNFATSAPFLPPTSQSVVLHLILCLLGVLLSQISARLTLLLL